MANIYVLSSWITSCLNGLNLSGWNTDEIVKRAGLNKNIFEQIYINNGQVFDLFNTAESLYGPSVGIDARKGIVPNSFGPVSLAFLASRNLRDGLNIMSKYNAIITNCYSSQLIETKQGCHFEFNITPDLTLPSTISDVMIATVIRTIRFVQPTQPTIVQVDIARPRPDNVLLYEAYFKAPIQWNAQRFAVHIKPDHLSIPSMHALPELLDNLENQCTERLENIAASSFLNAVRGCLYRYYTTNPGDQVCAIDHVSETFCISIRTLQRRLRDENTTFKQLQEEVKQSVAQRYIKNTSYSITYIAHALGFSDAGNFSRAFKRWYNCSPNQYRSQTN
ncbi:helix-turn-helix domain-containing protein [Bacterioplanoides sp.]|uniref:AraC family transcriptional regulator n=1 Tax=Bacterioplanoides sp. TaxID=2066072 RepID=UPI003B00D599